ncbi:uncharacterized protein LOC136033845 isoform X2 [Artemia franciscana]|uniref:Ribonuclease P protein subunit p29 n=2 Tax=Artemia franciscana TaxID=6661 RepID=A0AA88I8I9_ARTSF|nr:hypothetical protein QYM36_002247 [Artemia franciscana]
MDPTRKLPVPLRTRPIEYLVNTNDKNEVLKKVKEFLAPRIPQPSGLDNYYDFNVILSVNDKSKTLTTQKKKKKKLTSRKKREIGLHKLPKTGAITYKKATEMHSIWCCYFKDLLGIEEDVKELPVSRREKIYEVLPLADFQGCLLTVCEARNSSLLGQTGIVILETRNTIQIVSKDNQIRILPKMYTNFRFTFLGLEVTLFGRNMTTKPGARANLRKVKQGKTISVY